MTSVTHDDQDSCVIEDLEAPMDENNELSASPTLTQGVTAVSEEGDTHIVDLSDLGGAIVFKEDVKNQSASNPRENLGADGKTLAGNSQMAGAKNGGKSAGGGITTFEDNDSLTTASTLSLQGDFCKICHCGPESPAQPLIAPCFCAGSLKYVHQDCLQRWIKSSDIKRCELCKYPFDMQSKVKPFSQWEKLDMSSLERRKLLCSVSFHLIAVICVVWSLYVLIDRTADEIRTGVLAWPFWTKLVVVGIGFTGGLVFMYVQCKVYIHLCRKWKAYNRIIVVQDAPEGAAELKKARVAAAAAAEKAAKAAESAENERRPSSEPGRGAANPSSSVSEETNRSSSATAPGSTSDPTSRSMAVNAAAAAAAAASRSNAETQTALRGLSLMHRNASAAVAGSAVPASVRVERSKSSESLGAGAMASLRSPLASVGDQPGKVCKYVEGSAMFFTEECECSESQTCISVTKPPPCSDKESHKQEQVDPTSDSPTTHVLPGVVSQDEKMVDA